MRLTEEKAPPYQAERAGAKCDQCPLKDCHPVGPRWPVTSTKLIVIGTHPGDEEERKGEPFVGSTGKLADSIFRLAGIDKDTLHLTNAILCQPPWGTSDADLEKAVQACKPRLQRELAKLPPDIPVLSYGDLALQSTTGAKKVTEFMGVPIPSFDLGRMVLPAWHPAACLAHRNPAWRPVVTEHTARALDYAERRMRPWVWPRQVIQFPGLSEETSLKSATDDEVIAALELLSKAKHRGVDVETPKIRKPIEWETKGKQLLNIGIAAKDIGLSVCVTWPNASERVREAIRAHLALPIPTVMHNGFFDARIFILNGIELQGWTIDTMEMFRLVAPNIPRGLDTVACIETTAPRWKDDYRAKTKARKAEDIFLFGDPGQRADYCGKDSYLQDYLYPELEPQLDRLYNGPALYGLKHANILTGLKMWKFGVRIHTQNRENHRVPLEAKVASTRAEVVSLAKEAGYEPKKLKKATKRKPEEWLSAEFNPNSGPHVRGLFQHLGAHTGKYTATGLEQFDAEALTKLAAHPRSALVRRVARALLAWKKPSKALGTYVRNLPVWSDGRVHCEWRPGATKTARWASAGPNLQNQPGELRDMYAPDPGCWGLECDYSQLELRIVALLAGDEPLIEAYSKGLDVHRMNAADIFGIRPEQVSPAQRHFAKTFVYGCVTMDTQALTRNGWKYRHELSVGDEILTYNPVTKVKEWAPIERFTDHQDAEVYRLTNRSFDVKVTADHRWFTFRRHWDRNIKEPIHSVRTTAELSVEDNIIVNAPMGEDSGLNFYSPMTIPKYGSAGNWVKWVCGASSKERDAFLAGFLVADGHQTNGTWGFSQNIGEHSEAAFTAAVIQHDGCVYLADRVDAPKPMVTGRLSKKSHVTGQLLQKTRIDNQAVWCPTTKNGSWVMRQGNCVTITGNCNYGGGPETLWAQIVPDFPDIRVEAIARAREMWFKAHPAIAAWQESSLRTAYQKGYVEEKLSGHRIYTYGQNEPGMILNTPVQGAGAFMVNEAVEEVAAQLDWVKEAILFQVHDSLVTQGPNLGKLIKIVKPAMERPRILNGYEMSFPVDLKVFTNNWGTTVEMKADGTIKPSESESGYSCRKLWLALGEAFEENSELEWEAA